jgi:hypothetical protein
MKRTNLSKSLVIVIVSISAFGTEAFSKEWKGIVPCVSIRSEVEKILGRDSFPAPDSIGSYRYKNSKVIVYYERQNTKSPGEHVVKSMHVYPRKSIRLARYTNRVPDFQKNFEKRALDDRISHVRGLAVYRNWSEGFEIWVQKDEKGNEIITRFGYFDSDYKCSKQSSEESLSPDNGS